MEFRLAVSDNTPEIGSLTTKHVINNKSFYETWLKSVYEIIGGTEFHFYVDGQDKPYAKAIQHDDGTWEIL